MSLKVLVILTLMTQILAQDAIIDYIADDHKHTQTGLAGNAVRGSYSYIDADGQEYTVNYVADENGYRAEGTHLPGSVGFVQDTVQAPSAPSSVVVKPPSPPKVFPYSLYRPGYRPQLDFNYGYGYPLNYGSRYVYDPRYTYLF